MKRKAEQEQKKEEKDEKENQVKEKSLARKEKEKVYNSVGRVSSLGIPQKSNVE